MQPDNLGNALSQATGDKHHTVKRCLPHSAKMGKQRRPKKLLLQFNATVCNNAMFRTIMHTYSLHYAYFLLAFLGQRTLTFFFFPISKIQTPCYSSPYASEMGPETQEWQLNLVKDLVLRSGHNSFIPSPEKNPFDCVGCLQHFRVSTTKGSRQPHEPFHASALLTLRRNSIQQQR